MSSEVDGTGATLVVGTGKLVTGVEEGLLLLLVVDGMVEVVTSVIGHTVVVIITVESLVIVVVIVVYCVVCSEDDELTGEIELETGASLVDGTGTKELE